VPVLVDVVANDQDADGLINPATVQVLSGLHAGSVEIHEDGTVAYTPPTNAFGIDSFVYIVKDDDGATSNPAIVAIDIRSVWQNAENPVDVNGDGGLSPLDILQIVNALNFNGASLLEHPPSPPTAPPPFIDVTGDGYLTPADAMFAINCLNGQISGKLTECPLPSRPLLKPSQDTNVDGKVTPSAVDSDILSNGPSTDTEPGQQLDTDSGELVSVGVLVGSDLDPVLTVIAEDIRRSRLKSKPADEWAGDDTDALLIDSGLRRLEMYF
jgi:hypothetical protein